MNNKYVIGDIHGELEQLTSCIDRIKKIDTNPQLIFLGDYVDRGSDSCGVLDYLVELDINYNCKFLLGNHDKIWLDDLLRKDNIFTFEKQGAYETKKSYIDKRRSYYDDSHILFLQRLLFYHVDSDKNLYVHGGYNRHYKIDDRIHNSVGTLVWDRDFLSSALSNNVRKDNDKYPFKKEYNWVFLGHTPVQYYGFDTITILENSKVVMCDTGAGKWEDSVLKAICVETMGII
jgi:serine/threonine protein phosphatase 1